jgi:hypothetical protein
LIADRPITVCFDPDDGVAVFDIAIVVGGGVATLGGLATDDAAAMLDALADEDAAAMVGALADGDAAAMLGALAAAAAGTTLIGTTGVIARDGVRATVGG